MKPSIEHIDYGRHESIGPDHRTTELVKALQLTLSPIDLKCIISILDYKGTLEVTMDKELIDYLNSKTNNEQQSFVEFTIKAAWDVLGEPNCEFKYCLNED